MARFRPILFQDYIRLKKRDLTYFWYEYTASDHNFRNIKNFVTDALYSTELNNQIKIKGNE